MRLPSATALRALPHLIRFRLTLWYTGLVALVLAAFVWAVFAAFSQYQQSVEDYTALLTQTFRQQVVQVGLPPYSSRGYGIYPPNIGDDYYALRLKDPDAPSKAGYPMTFYDLTTGQLIGAPPTSPVLTTGAARTARHAVAAAARRGASAAPVVTTTAQWRFITIRLSYAGDKVVGQIAVPMAHVDYEIAALKRILVSAAAALLLISAVGGWVLAHRALAPVDALTRRARRITEHDLSQRFNVALGDELGRLAAAFDDMIGRLDAAFERQKRFTADASHELRTPLAAMQADAELALARPRSNAEYREALERVVEEVGHLDAVVAGLLALTRIDVDPAGLARAPVALDRLLGGLVERIGVLAEERGVALGADHLDPVTIIGDATRLRQLFGNVLDNAVAYTPAGGRVAVGVEGTRDGARVTVVDTGIGIAPEHLPRIFERFYRADAARERRTGGTGLDLAVAQAVARAHHGEIAIESAPGAGTTVTVTLPGGGGARSHGRGLRALIGTTAR
jgi:heavy metal sensor kinase